MDEDISRKFNAYLNAQTTVNKVQQVIMLYNGIIKHITKVKEAIAENDIQSRYNFLDKAAAIILGLQTSLDFDKGGEVSKLLDNYYYSIYMRIMSIHNTNSIEMCDQIIKELKMMKESWEDIDKSVYGVSINDDEKKSNGSTNKMIG
ncbi:MAG: flagellar export chaperone FliS [Sphingobacteriia bacterium]|nr:flagellar export chaperone FliS [Sphingobacteriia bacterium]